MRVALVPLSLKQREYHKLRGGKYGRMTIGRYLHIGQLKYATSVPVMRLKKQYRLNDAEC